MSHSAAFTPIPGQVLMKSRVILAEQPTPTSMDDNGVACFEGLMLSLERTLEVFDTDFIRVIQHLNSFVSGNINQNSAGDESSDFLNA